MQHYVGLDVSLKQTAVCVVDQAGKIRREGMVASDPKAIADFIVANASQVIRIGFESGATSTWLWTELKKFGLPVICIDARHAKAALKMQINKSDRNDAVGIAPRIMQCGWYVEPLLKTREAIGRQIADLDRKVLRLARSTPQVRRFMTVPGIGPITALCYLATINDPTRFKKSRSVGAYVGLTTRRYASGETDRTGRISKCGDGMLRSYLYEAANVLLTRVAKWSALKVWGMRIARRRSLSKARVAVARKLAVILHRMWIDGTEFSWSSEGIAM